ncbi:MAG: UDP-N-acetylglucosamine 4,6-dehydratase (inverting) [Deltaproteobacteria bacterium]|nr:MAG: UDP-N-acetylglucosamine 4,6-dehydratase (inverting) [Deltaproteobacteria bacterium]
MNVLNGASILVTGGTGSFGKAFIRKVLAEHEPERVIVFSRDELKQFEMQGDGFTDKRLRFFLGDVRDRDRLFRAFDGVDVVVHAAALKQVPACEYNPFEAIRTNVIGGQNIIDMAIERGVRRVLALSTDKACNPANLYGATKLCSDKLFIAGNHYVGDKDTAFAVVRYGNVVGSRGSVVPFFVKQRATGRLPVTHEAMTRFWITLAQGVQFVLDSLERMQGGELFVPKIPSMNVMDLARAIGPDCEIDIVGIRPGEKLHEVMISEDDARNTLDMGSHFILQPEFSWWKKRGEPHRASGTPVPDGFRYSSDNNDTWLTTAQLRDIIRPFDPQA